MQIGSTEIEDEVWIELERRGVRVDHEQDSDEVFLSISDPQKVAANALGVIELVVQTCPDECWIEQGGLRLWWD